MTVKWRRGAIAGGVLVMSLSGCAWIQNWLHKPVEGDLVGNWSNPIGTVWMIKADGTYDVDLTKTGQRDAWGKYSIDKDTVTLTAVGGLMPRGCNGPGVYHFKRADNQLTFTLISDNCRLRRRNVLLPWTLKK